MRPWRIVQHLSVRFPACTSPDDAVCTYLHLWKGSHITKIDVRTPCSAVGPSSDPSSHGTQLVALVIVMNAIQKPFEGLVRATYTLVCVQTWPVITRRKVIAIANTNTFACLWHHLSRSTHNISVNDELFMLTSEDIIQICMHTPLAPRRFFSSLPPPLQVAGRARFFRSRERIDGIYDTNFSVHDSAQPHLPCSCYPPT